jgi:aspartate/methionine/tyrosine aminotransferase
LRLNPLLAATASPPIPEARAWAARYDGSKGPLIDLSQAVPGYPPHPEMLKRLGEAAASRDAAQYGPITGDEALRSAYAKHVSSAYRGRIAPEDIAITAGCNQAFVVAILALAKAGDGVMLPTPWYFNHKMALDMLGIETVPLPCRAENGFVPEAKDARVLLHDQVRAILLVTPNNPTGAVYPPATIIEFKRLCAERRIILILDETYRDFLPSIVSPHSLFVNDTWRRTVIQLYSFSKAYCIPGHRVGALLADAVVIREVAKILDTVQISPPRAPQLALPWAIEALADWRADNRDEIGRRAVAFKDAVDALAGWSIGSIGAYFAYVAHPFTESDQDVCARLAGDHGILCLPGSYFGPSQEGFLRFAFANTEAGLIAEIPGRLQKKRASAIAPSAQRA